jgi:hypothetical protein
VLQGLEFIADNKEEQSRTLLGNVASVNDELQGNIASLHTGAFAATAATSAAIVSRVGGWQQLQNKAVVIACCMQPPCCP